MKTNNIINVKNESKIVSFLCFAIPLFLFVEPIFGLKSFYWGTAGLQFIPWSITAARSIWEGIVPWWNPLNGLGAPLIANYQSAVFYPPNWIPHILYGFFNGSGAAWGYTLLTYLHLVWAGLGIAQVLKQIKCNEFGQIIGAIAYSLSGYFITRIGFFSILWTASWIPWVTLGGIKTLEIYLLKKKQTNWKIIGKNALVFTALLLAGHAQTAFYSIVFVFCLVVFLSWISGGGRLVFRTLPSLIIALSIAVITSSVQLYPTLEYLSESQRSSSVDYVAGSIYSFWPLHLLTLVLPNLFGSPQAGTYRAYGAYWEDNIYIGLLAFIFALTTLKIEIFNNTKKNNSYKLFFWISILGSFVLMLGKFSPIFPFLFENIPTFNLFQGPTRWSIIFVFSFCVLAGLGASDWSNKRLIIERNWKAILFVGLGFILGGYWTVFFLRDIPVSLRVSTIIFGIGLAITSVLFIIYSHLGDEKRKQRFQWFFLTFLSCDLWFFGWRALPTINASLFNSIPFDSSGRLFLDNHSEYQIKFNRFVRFEDSNPIEDMTHLHNVMLPNFNLVNHIAIVNNFDPFISERLFYWLNQYNSLEEFAQLRWLNWMDVNRILEYDYHVPSGITINRVSGSSFFHFFPCSVVISDPEGQFEYLSGSQYSDNYLLLENPSFENQNCNENMSGFARITTENDVQIVINVTTNRPGWIMISNIWYPGWIAELNGSPTRLYRGHFMFQAVYLPEGSTELTIRYQPGWLPLVIGLSLTGLFIILSTLIIKRATKSNDEELCKKLLITRSISLQKE